MWTDSYIVVMVMLALLQHRLPQKHGIHAWPLEVSARVQQPLKTSPNIDCGVQCQSCHAGYYNVEAHDGYAGILELCAQHGLVATLTCVEMCDGQHPPEALCGPEGLLRQVKPAVSSNSTMACSVVCAAPA